MDRVLIVEDDPRIASFLDKGLTAHGYATKVVRSTAETERAIAAGGVDVVILDPTRVRAAPRTDVVDIRRVRRWSVPVIILDVQEVVDDRALNVAGHEATNEESIHYLVKPFRFEELLALVRALLGEHPDRSNMLTHHEVTLDLSTRRVTVGGRQAQLTPREFGLAETFLRHPGQAFSRAQLLDRVWGLQFDPASNVVDVYVRYLRRKLGRDLIETVRGVGYRLQR